MNATLTSSNWLDKFIAKTYKICLISFGLATCLPILMVINLEFSKVHLFSGLIDYTPASVPALRHWGFMVFGIGALMVVSAFRPWLRFEILLFCMVEKAFMVYLYFNCIGQLWDKAYTIGFILDFTISFYCMLYFISSYGRRHKWIQQDEVAL